MVANAAEEARKEQIELNKSTIEDANKVQENVESERKLFESLEGLDEQYKKGEISRSELKASIQDLLNQYDL